MRGGSDGDEVSICGILQSMERHAEVLTPDRHEREAQSVAPSDRFVELEMGHYVDDWCIDGIFATSIPHVAIGIV